MSDDLQKATDLQLLPAWYYEAFGLRMKGANYDKIAEKVDKKPQTVRALFAKSGKLYAFWREYVESNKAENVDEAMDMMFGQLPDILRMQIVAAQDHGENPMVALLARHKIMDYTLGKPEERLKINASLVTLSFTEWVKQITLKEEDDRKRTAEEVPKGSD